MRKKVKAIIHTEKRNEVKNALFQKGIVGWNVVNVTGRGRQQGLSYNEKIFIIPVEQVIRVRTGERGTDVL